MYVKIKFCLDDDTLELQKKILKEKREEKDKKEGEEKSKENEKNIHPLGISDIKMNKSLDLIKEGDEEEKEDEEEEIKTNQKENIDNDSGYLLAKIDLSDDKGDADNVPLYAGLSHFRNTINSFFNNKKIMFPKLHNKLRDTIAIKDQYISEVKVAGKLPVPYLSAIKLLTTLKKYKAPFEKIVIIAAISDQITECATTFWSEMEKYIKKDFLSIEADEIMAIFLFIVIRSQN